MAQEISKHVEYYYDSHPTEEDLMGETVPHSRLIHYLSDVLNWLFHDQNCAVYENLNFYQTFDYHEYPVAPDLAIIKGVMVEDVRSWSPQRIGIAPHVIFEILSEETWKKDLREKPAKYASLGVQEYFAYDPYEPPLRRATTRRLFGYRLDARHQQMIEMQPDAQGRLWSEQLQCWLVPQGKYLRLYDRHSHLCLTEAEAQAALRKQATEQAARETRQAAEARRQAAREARRAEEEARRAEEEAHRAEEAIQQALEARRAEEEAIRQALEARRAEEEAIQQALEARRAEEEARRLAQALAEKLRALGIDPGE